MKDAITRRDVLAVCVATAVSPLRAIDARLPAPRFRAKSLDGESYSNDTLKGKVTLIQFWTTWCQYCRRDQPAVETIAGSFSSEGLVVLAVNVGESRKKVKDYLKMSPRLSKVVLTEDTNLAALFAAKAFPVYVAIDRAGKIAGEVRGAIGEGGLRGLIATAGIDGAREG
jgi:thiol-disulfide isomerase/thioredoxin